MHVSNMLKAYDELLHSRHKASLKLACGINCRSVLVNQQQYKLIASGICVLLWTIKLHMHVVGNLLIAASRLL